MSFKGTPNAHSNASSKTSSSMNTSLNTDPDDGFITIDYQSQKKTYPNKGYNQSNTNKSYNQPNTNKSYNQPNTNKSYNQSNTNKGYNQSNSNKSYNQSNSNKGYNQSNSNMNYNQPNSNMGYNQSNSNMNYNQPNSNMGYNQSNSNKSYNQQNTINNGNTVNNGNNTNKGYNQQNTINNGNNTNSGFNATSTYGGERSQNYNSNNSNRVNNAPRGGQNHNSTSRGGQNQSYPSRGKGSTGTNGGYGNQRRHEALSLKYDAKNAIGREDVINRISVEDIRCRINDICSKRKISLDDESERHKVQATVLGIVLKYVPHIREGMSSYIMSIANLITEIMPSEEKNNNEVFNGKETKETKGAMGYQLLNAICYPGITTVSSIDEFVGAIETLINVCKCDVLAKNDKGETALAAYDAATERNFAPKHDLIRTVLSAGIRQEHLEKLVHTIVNKLSISNLNLSNIFKLVCSTDATLLADKLIDNLFKFYAFSKKEGCFPCVNDLIDACHNNIYADIINDEWTTILSEKFRKNTQDSDKVYYNLLEKLAESAVKKLPERRKFMESKSSEECAAIAIDVIGAIIGDVAAINNGPHYNMFVKELLPELDNQLVQNLVLTATCHLLARLKKIKPNDQCVMLNFITPNIFEAISHAAKEKKLAPRVCFTFQNSMKNFTGIDIECSQFITITEKLFNNNGKIESKITAKTCVNEGLTINSGFKSPIKKTQINQTNQLNKTQTNQTNQLNKTSQINKTFQINKINSQNQSLKKEIEVEVKVDIDTMCSNKYVSCIPKELKYIKVSEADNIFKKGDEWNDDEVEEWICSRIGEEKLQVNELHKKIRSIIIITTDYGIIQKDQTTKINLFKRMLDDIYGADTVAKAIMPISELSVDDRNSMWDDKSAIIAFEQFAKLY